MKQKESKSYIECMRIQLIPKNEILLSKNFLIFFESEPIYNPIFIFLKQNQKLYPINNFRILRDYLDSNIDLTGIIFDCPRDLIQILKIFYRENSLNLIEKIQLAKFLNFFKIEELIPHFNTKQFLKYEEILTLTDEAIDLIAKDIIPTDLAMKLKSIEQYKIEIFLKLVKDFKLTQSQQREVISFMKDRANDDELKKMIKESNDRETLIEKIREITLPQYTQTKKLFDKNKKKLHLPAKVNIIETPFFESKNMKIEIFFRDFNELRDRISKLSKNIEEKKNIWEEIFSIT